MKFSNYLLGMLTCAAFTACSSDELEMTGSGPIGNESQGNAYLAVNIVANTDATKRAFEDGTAAESNVTSARFYFFDANGQPVAVNNQGTNYIEKTDITWINEENPNTTDNVTKKSSAILVIDNKKVLPTSMITILNPPQELGVISHAEEDLHTNHAENYASDAYTQDGTFVMSTSNYIDANNNIHDADVIAGYLATSSADANLNPVNVYVERVAAKVEVTQAQTKFDTGVKTPVKSEEEGSGTTGEEKPIYAKITGWAIANRQDRSYPVKQLNSKWTNGSLFENWNQAANHRCYWAQTVPGEPVNDNTWAGTNSTATKYVNENTGGTQSGKTPILFVAAQLVDANNDPVEIVNLAGTNMTMPDAKIWIAGVLNAGNTKIVYKKDETTFEEILPEHLDFTTTTTNADIESYQVVPCVAETTPQLYSQTNGGERIEISKEEVNALLAEYPANVWKNGMTYYYTTITHMDEKYPGIVRNNVYKIDITKIKGLGTPVFDPDQIITEPEEVIDQSSYMSATINILAWNIINQSVELGK